MQTVTLLALWWLSLFYLHRGKAEMHGPSKLKSWYFKWKTWLEHFVLRSYFQSKMRCFLGWPVILEGVTCNLVKHRRTHKSACLLISSGLISSHLISSRLSLPVYQSLLHVIVTSSISGTFLPKLVEKKRWNSAKENSEIQHPVLDFGFIQATGF